MRQTVPFPQPPRQSNSAFTLVEILVVISIISLLLALLMPTLSKARESSTAVQCMSNQRQIGLTMSNYAADHKGYFPPREYAPGFPSGNPFPEQGKNWGRLLVDYELPIPAVGRPHVLVCPTSTAGWFSYDRTYGVYFSGFSSIQNPATLAAFGRIGRWESQMVNNRSHPSGTWVMGDTSTNTGVQTYYFQYANGDNNLIHTRHADAANILFLDMHVEPVRAWPSGTRWRLFSDNGNPAGSGWRMVAYFTASYVKVTN